MEVLKSLIIYSICAKLFMMLVVYHVHFTFLDLDKPSVQVH